MSRRPQFEDAENAAAFDFMSPNPGGSDVSRSQRRKGAQGEREAAELLTDLLGQCIKRRLGQAREGGHDLTVFTDRDAGFVVEVKRHEQMRPYPWMQQAEEAAELHGESWKPAVMARTNGKGWLVTMQAEDWAELVREAMR